jgi:hypothetical protein
MFVQRVVFHAAQGKGRELRALLEERVKSAQSQGVAAALSVQMFGGGGFTMTIRYNTLAELEERRAGIASDPAFQAWVTKVAAVTRQPNESELYEVLIPLPS